MTVEPGVRVGHDKDASTSDASVIEWSWDEPEAFAALFDRHADSVHRYAARRLGPEVAEDLMAETFTIAFQQRFRYNTELPDARPWLFGIATNLVGRHRRAEARRLKAIGRLPSAAPAAGSEDTVAERVVARVGAQALRGELALGMARLPARHRDVLLLVAWADLGYEEVARALEIPVGTVRSRLHRARRKLRDALGGSDPTALQEEPDVRGGADMRGGSDVQEEPEFGEEPDVREKPDVQEKSSSERNPRMRQRDEFAGPEEGGRR